jgi:hypothetical protein
MMYGCVTARGTCGCWPAAVPTKRLAKVVAALERVKIGKAVHDLDAVVKVGLVVVLQHLWDQEARV